MSKSFNYQAVLSSFLMNSILPLLNPVKELLKNHPYAFGFTTVLSLLIFALRKIHHKFVVFPNVNGRSNSSNPFQYQHPANRGMDSEDVDVITSDKMTLRGWYIKQKNPEYLIVYYHENAGNIGGRLYFIGYLMEKIKANVLIIAYRGFSDSDGDSPPNQSNIMTDSKAIFQRAIELSQRDHIPLIVFGRSLGGASSINTLSQPQFRHAAKGLILENTFTSIFDVAMNLTPKFLLPFLPIIWMITADSYNSFRRIKDVHVPILFVKGCRDTLIPKKLMDTLQNRYHQLRRENFSYEVERGTHNDTWIMGGKLYFDRLNEFMTYCSKL